MPVCQPFFFPTTTQTSVRQSGTLLTLAKQTQKKDIIYHHRLYISFVDSQR